MRLYATATKYYSALHQRQRGRVRHGKNRLIAAAEFTIWTDLVPVHKAVQNYLEARGLEALRSAKVYVKIVGSTHTKGEPSFSLL